MLEFLLGYIIGMIVMYILGKKGFSIEIEFLPKKGDNDNG